MYGGIGIVVGVVFIKWGEVRQERRIRRRAVLLSDPATGPLSIVEVTDEHGGASPASEHRSSVRDTVAGSGVSNR